jgi:glycerol-3-phosphate dehydrogenase subunit B
VPATMVAGDASKRNPMLIVGFDRFYDFFPEFIAANLSAQGILSTAVSLDLTSLRSRKFLTGMNLANLFDNPDFRQEVIDALKPRLGKVERVGFPGVLGLHKSAEVLEHLQSSLEIPVFEIPGLPPSIPGIRLQNLLIAAIQRQHGAVFTGMPVISLSATEDTIQAVWTKSAARQLSHSAKTYVLATGGILGGGISVNNLGYAQESVFDLPLVTPEHRSDWFQADFLAAQGHPIFRSGVSVDHNFRPLDLSGNAQYANLHVIGSALANFDPIHERSLEGIALATGFRAAQLIAAGIPS